QVLCLLRMFDDTWSHQCESLRSVPEGVTSEESLWQSPAYMAEPWWKGSPRQEPFTVYSWCLRCPAHLRQALLRSLGLRGFLRRHPSARRAGSKQQARHFNVICAVLRRVSPAFTCPHQRSRGEHAIYGIQRRALRQQNLYCFHLAGHRGTMECFYSIAV